MLIGPFHILSVVLKVGVNISGVKCGSAYVRTVYWAPARQEKRPVGQKLNFGTKLTKVLFVMRKLRDTLAQALCCVLAAKPLLTKHNTALMAV